MDPSEALARIILHTNLNFDFPDEVILGRRQLIMTAGYNPDEWIWFSNDFVGEQETYAEMVNNYTKNFPKGIDFLVTPGNILGGLNKGNTFDVGGGTVTMGGFASISVRPNGYTIFLKLSEDKSAELQK